LGRHPGPFLSLALHQEIPKESVFVQAPNRTKKVAWTKNRLDPEFVYRPPQDADVAAEHLGQNLVYLPLAALGAGVAAELALYGGERRLDVAAHVVAGGELFAVEHKRVVHPRPDRIPLGSTLLDLNGM